MGSARNIRVDKEHDVVVDVLHKGRNRRLLDGAGEVADFALVA